MSLIISRFKKFLIDSSGIYHNKKRLNNYLEYKPGDVYEGYQLCLSGHITSSTTTCRLAFTFDKDISNVNINILNFEAEARCGSGYLNNESGYHEFVGRSGYKISVEKKDSHNVTFYITKSSAFTNVTNNTLINFYTHLKVSFS